MKDSFGNSVSVTISGESHGAALVAVLSGLAPGIPVDEDFIAAVAAMPPAAGIAVGIDRLVVEVVTPKPATLSSIDNALFHLTCLGHRRCPHHDQKEDS